MMRVQLKHACQANCARNTTAEENTSALQAQVKESPLARWRRAGTAALVCSLSTPKAAEANEGSEGEAAAAARLLELSLLADAAEAEVAQRELGRRIALRVGSKQVKAMRNSDATRRQIQAEVLAERDSALLGLTATPSLHDRTANGMDTRPRETTESVVNRILGGLPPHLLDELMDEVARENATINDDNWVPPPVDPDAARAVAMRVSARQNTAVALRAFIHRE